MQKLKVTYWFKVGKRKAKQVTLRTEIKSQINAWRNEKVNPQSQINHLPQKHEYGSYEKATAGQLFRWNGHQVTKITAIKTLKNLANQVAVSQTWLNSQRVPSKQNQVRRTEPSDQSRKVTDLKRKKEEKPLKAKVGALEISWRTQACIKRVWRNHQA